MITRIEDYFAKGCGRCARFDTADCATQVWRRDLADLRRICLEAALVETAKWGHPCSMHAGRNVALIGAFRTDLRLSFFHAALMKDPEGLLERTGPNTRHPDMIRFSFMAQVAAMEPVVRAYLAEAMGYAAAGISPPKGTGEVELPAELVMAMDEDPELAKAFDRLTPGRQRSYIINLGTAKKSETRRSRISAFRDQILAGKGATER